MPKVDASAEGCRRSRGYGEARSTIGGLSVVAAWSYLSTVPLGNGGQAGMTERHLH